MPKKKRRKVQPPGLPDDEARALCEALTAELWERGEIEWKLKPCQLQMLHDILGSKRFKWVIKCARRLGKSYLLCWLAIVTCLKKPGAQVRYAAPTGKMLRKIVRPIMRKILEDCPVHLRPKWVAAESMYAFPNPDAVDPKQRYEGGSEIHLAGVNNGRADDLRGPACDLFLIDEAGFIDDLHYLVHDVAMPQFLDPDGSIVEGRRLVMSSSPPRSPAHEFTAMARLAEFEGNYSHYDIFAGGYSLDVLRMFLREDGVPEADIEALLSGNVSAIKSTTVKREYLALDVVDAESALVPEWTGDFVVMEQNGGIPIDEFFPFYFKYDSLDIGVQHKTVCVFGHIDFRRARLFIHDEVAMNGPEMTTEKLALAIKEKEREVFGIPDRKDELYSIRKRISDRDLLLIQDLRHLHKLPFLATDKGELEQMVNEVRIFVGAKKLYVHERCKQLIGCLAYGVWNKKRTDFDTSPQYGHFDALAALMYLVRNITSDWKVNPIPPDFGKPSEDHWFVEDPKKKGRRDKIKRAFGGHVPGRRGNRA